DRCAGVDQSGRIVKGAAQGAVRANEKIGSTRVAGCRGDVCKHEQNIHLRLVPGKGEAGEIRRAFIDPEGVGVEDVERLCPQFGQCLDDSAGRVQQEVALVGNGNLGRSADGYVGDDLLGKIVDVDHRL